MGSLDHLDTGDHPRLDLRVDYTRESNYSNDPDREYGAHLLWTGLGLRW